MRERYEMREMSFEIINTSLTPPMKIDNVALFIFPTVFLVCERESKNTPLRLFALVIPPALRTRNNGIVLYVIRT